MRRPIIVGNWKMNMLISTADEWMRELLHKSHLIDSVDIVVAPPFTALAAVRERIKESKIHLAGQNIGSESIGGQTGEVSAAMLRDAGCDYVILGHSERRRHFFETDQIINRKISLACDQELNIIFCIGESLDDRENGRANEVVKGQLAGALADLNHDKLSRLVIAYEPVWAIGTGHNASPKQAQDIHRLIRIWCEKSFGVKKAMAIRILYGGSVKAETSAALMVQPDLDGLLVGGASLDPDSFYSIINSSI